MYFTCTKCGITETNPKKPVWLCSCGGPRSVRYDWEDKRFNLQIIEDDLSLWRYKKVLPEVSDVITLGEGHTPLVAIGENLFVKDETVNPTGSFKDRGMSLAITMAKAQGVENICLPSAGNAGVSAAAYCEKAEIACHVFLPETIPEEFQKETSRYNANIVLKGQTIADAGKEMMDQKQKDWFDISTLKEPFRVEGKKTLGYEIAEQLNWSFPDVIIYETGGGTGLIGMWKAFEELKNMGKINDKLPRMVSAQSDGCAPVVKAFQSLEKNVQFWKNSQTIALGLNVPGPLGGAWILDILYRNNGVALSVPEKNLKDLTKTFNSITGINSSAEGGVVWGAYNALKDIDWIKPSEKVVLFATGKERCKLE